MPNRCKHVTPGTKRQNDGDSALHKGARTRYDPFQVMGGSIMKRILLSGIGLFAAIAVATPALADEPVPVRHVKPARVTRHAPPRRVVRPVRQEPVRQAKSWSGGQVGASNGGSFASNNFVEPGAFICPPVTYLGYGCYETPFSFRENAPSYTVGPFLGYRIQLGSFVVGVEGDASYKKSESSVSQLSTTPFSGPGFGYSRTDNFYGSLKQGWDGSVRGRLGVLITPSILVYGTGGVAFGKVSGSLTYSGVVCVGVGPCLISGNSYATATTSFSETRVGATGGGGIEFQLFGPWNARVEYRYTDLGSFSKSAPVVNSSACTPGSQPSCSLAASIDLHPTFHTVRFGLGLDF
jgi:outer membrane immunogenic protein